MRQLKIFLIVLSLSACAQMPAQHDKDNADNNTVQWDFEHEVQFEQKALGPHSYHIVVRSNGKTQFAKLATFLLRQSYDLCKSYGFKLEVLQGVEGVYDRVAFPHLLMGSLAANLECPQK